MVSSVKNVLSIFAMFPAFVYECSRQRCHVFSTKIVAATLNASYATFNIMELLYGGDLGRK